MHDILLCVHVCAYNNKYIAYIYFQFIIKVHRATNFQVFGRMCTHVDECVTPGHLAIQLTHVVGMCKSTHPQDIVLYVCMYSAFNVV